MASFPSAIKSFTTRVNGDTVTPAMFNDLQDEVTAIQTWARSSLFTAVTSGALPDWQSYTPTWTNGSIGNGTLAGRYLDMGDIEYLAISVTAGSTTTFGAGGNWTFSLPVGVTGTIAVLSAFYFDGSTPYTGSGYLASSTTVGLVAITPTTSGFVTNAHPFAWANTHIMQVCGLVFKA